jgi:DNA topoisomerase IB
MVVTVAGWHVRAGVSRLVNTREVSRKCYANPRVPESYVDGTLDGTLDDTFRRAEPRRRLKHSESAVLIVVTAGDAVTRLP